MLEEVPRAGTVLLLLLLVSSCSSPAEPQGERAGTEASAIVHGTTTDAHPEAVLLEAFDGSGPGVYCTGAAIAPRVVLTAGHCVAGFDTWAVTAPAAGGQARSASTGETYDWRVDSLPGDPGVHDVGVVVLDAPIELPSYPTLATSPLADGSTVILLGRVADGKVSYDAIVGSAPLIVRASTSDDPPFDYVAAPSVEQGDSGGPVETDDARRMIVAVNSAEGPAGGLLARVDTVEPWLGRQIASHSDAAGASRGCTSAPVESASRSPVSWPAVAVMAAIGSLLRRRASIRVV